MKRAFTLVELLVVISIVATLSALLFPAIVAAKGAAYGVVAMSNVRGVDAAALMYVGDHDEAFMPRWAPTSVASGPGSDGPRAPARTPTRPSCASTGGRRRLADPLAPQGEALPGRCLGLRLQLGYIGSDMHVSGTESEFPSCLRPARMSDLGHPSSTVVFATSGYFSAPWEGGDGTQYDFGFVDPVGSRRDNPNVAFRHGTPPRAVGRTVETKGRAMIATADGGARSISRGALGDDWFERDAL